MTYSTSTPPAKISQTMGGNSVWFYASADADGTVNGSDYFSNGDALGMQVGDIVFVYDSGNVLTSVCYVSAVTAGGAATTAFAAVA